MTDHASTWAETRRCLGDDAVRLRRFQQSKFGYRLRLWFIDPAWAAVLLYRLSALAWSRGYLKFGRLMMQVNSLVTGVDIHPASVLGAGLLIPSPCGVTISCRAGRNLTMLGLSGLGGSTGGRDAGAGPGLPVLGDDVMVGPFSGIQNGILVGDGASTDGGAGAAKDVPAGVRMVLATSPLIIGPVTDLEVSPHRQLPACPHGTWSSTKADIRADIDRYLAEVSHHHPVASGAVSRLSGFLTNPVLATALHRIAHWQHVRGRPGIAVGITRVNLLLNRLTITPDSCIGGGLFVPHLAGTLFRGHAGANLTLYANSLCAPAGVASTLHAAPVLGDNVSVGGHSAIIGPVVIGSHVRLARKAQVMRDVPDWTDVFSPMARYTRGGEAIPVPTPEPSTREPLPWMTARRTMRDRIKQDRVRLAACLPVERPGFPGLTCARLHRRSHALYVSGHRRLARWVWLLNAVLTGADISPASDLGPGLVIPHPAGICIHATAGSGLTLLAQTGIGPSTLIDGELPPLSLAPSVGDDVHLSHHSGIFGTLSVGDRVHLTAGCIATHPVINDVTLSPRPVRSRPSGLHSSGLGGDDVMA
jgi:serine O-acetyltransferase